MQLMHAKSPVNGNYLGFHLRAVLPTLRDLFPTSLPVPAPPWHQLVARLSQRASYA